MTNCTAFTGSFGSTTKLDEKAPLLRRKEVKPSFILRQTQTRGCAFELKPNNLFFIFPQVSGSVFGIQQQTAFLQNRRNIEAAVRGQEGHQVILRPALFGIHRRVFRSVQLECRDMGIMVGNLPPVFLNIESHRGQGSNGHHQPLLYKRFPK